MIVPRRRHARPALAGAATVAARYAGQYVSSALKRKAANIATAAIDQAGATVRRAIRRRPRRYASPSQAVVTDKPGNSFSSSKFVSGKKRSVKSAEKALLRTAIVSSRYTFRNVNNLAASMGAYTLGFSQFDANVDLLPVFLFNLSSVRQSANNDDSIAPRPFFRMFLDNSQNRIGFAAQDGSQENAFVSQFLQHEDNPGWAQTLNCGRVGYLDWASIKLCVRGKTSAPTRVMVQLIKVTRDEMTPEASTVLAATPVSSSLATSEVLEQWAPIIKPLITNPCVTQRRTRNYVKVLKTITLDIDPKSTTEADTLPDQKHVNLFHRMGKVMRYHAPGPVTTASAMKDPNRWNDASLGTANAVNAAYRAYPNPIRSSIYLLIRSMQTTYVSGLPGIPTNANTASFDMNIRTAFKNIKSDY